MKINAANELFLFIPITSRIGAGWMPNSHPGSSTVP
jgi:hypothetical protein